MRFKKLSTTVLFVLIAFLAASAMFDILPYNSVSNASGTGRG